MSATSLGSQSCIRGARVHGGRLQSLEEAVSNLLVPVSDGEMSRVERYLGGGRSLLMEMLEASC
jgi:hypothetical protein